MVLHHFSEQCAANDKGARFHFRDAIVRRIMPVLHRLTGRISCKYFDTTVSEKWLCLGGCFKQLVKGKNFETTMLSI